MHCLLSATNKENFEEFRERVYEAVRHIHITRFPHNKFYILIIRDAVEKEVDDDEETE
jgi:GTP-binding protein HflX